MATLTTQKAKTTGQAITMAAASGGGDKVDAGDHTALLVTNGGGSSINVTVAVPGNTKYGAAEPDIVVAVAAGATKLIGPLPTDLEDTTTDRLVAVTYSGVTSVTVAAIEI
ncbi:hypothetical protein [Nocardioides sp. PD653]|uniref:hypothetical protein n=1 Tax=Nocardioides sp. PD653 TaxID=393303 RepID=UPI0009F12B9D|nr:hypothetical protein [Nocardioides sp. PD653]GAW54741.1 uncharacterized protein PD653_2155 [Nocardioides sp. PD653]